MFFFIFNLLFISYQTVNLSSSEENKITLKTDKRSKKGSDFEFPGKKEISEIKEKKIFGQPEDSQEDAHVKFKVSKQIINHDVMENAPESRLQAKITGLLYSADRAKSVVIIERSGKQESYGEGERITGLNAEILMILQDKLIINENGYYTRMLF